MWLCAADISVFMQGQFLVTGIQQGVASGSYSSVACGSPQGGQWWWRLMHTGIPAAMIVQQWMLHFFDECIVPFKDAGYSIHGPDKRQSAVGAWLSVGTRPGRCSKWIDQEVTAAQARARALLPAFFI